jgi:uncharacterized protein YbcI
MVEADVASASVKFQREQQGRGPSDVKAHLVGDMLLVRSAGIFTTTEEKLSASEEGRRLIRSARHEMRSISRSEIENTISVITGIRVLRSYFDVDVAAAEQVEVYVLEADLERRLLRKDLDQLSGLAPGGSGKR